MEEKLFTNLSPTARWIILPFACVLAPVIVSLLVGVSIILTLGLNAEEEYPIISSLIEFNRSFGMGFVFARAALYVAPSHTRIVMQIVRIIGVFLIVLFSLLLYENNLLDWKNSIHSLLMLIGILIRLDDESEIIEEFD